MQNENEIELLTDGDGLAIIGHPTAVDLFLASEGLASRDLGLSRLAPALGLSSGVAAAASAIAANSGRWVKLTEESVAKINRFGLMKGSSGDLSRAIVQAKGGEIKAIVEFSRGSAAMLTNPAILAGAAGIMSQLAMQQAMDAITEYLATIDEKVDDLLRAQKDSVLAEMIGVDFVIEEAMTIRGQVGRVSEVTWSKVQGTSMSIARTQGYALRQLDALAEKTERKADVDDLAKMSKEVEAKVQEWLVVLARCFQLQDAIAVLEIDRVLDAAPAELDQHRIALRVARQNRLQSIAGTTQQLILRMDDAAKSSNATIVLNPFSSRAVVRASNKVASAVGTFRTHLGLDDGRQSLEETGWLKAAAGLKDEVLEGGADRIDAAGRFGIETVDRARSLTDKLSIRLAEGALRRRGEKSDREDGPEGGPRLG